GNDRPGDHQSQGRAYVVHCVLLNLSPHFSHSIECEKCGLHIPGQTAPLGSPSGRISGVVKNTPSGVGLGVGVTAVCGDPATPVSSWMRISSAKSSCTVLWQWLT